MARAIPSTDIDAVITWVDGDDPEFRALRDHHAAVAKADPLDPDHHSQLRFTRTRYADAGELRYCLRSILRFGKFIRKIWIVTAGHLPKYFDRAGMPDNISFVSHREIFQGYEDCLPTFNSEAIESMLWRIDGLAENFLYFNDDVMLLSGARQEHFFAAAHHVHGHWRDADALGGPQWLETRVNAARLFGFDRTNFLLEAHAVHPLVRSEFASLVADKGEQLCENLRYRFRNRNSIYPISLYNHRLLRLGLAEVRRPAGVVIVDRAKGLAAEGSIETLKGKLLDRRARMACFNSFGELKFAVPGISTLMDEVFGPPLVFERQNGETGGI